MLDPLLTSLFVLSFAIAFLMCLFFLPPYIRKAHQVKMVGVDIHRSGLPEIAECGGVILVIAYLIGLFFFVPFNVSIVEASEQELVGTAATVLFLALVGFFDDVYCVRWRIKSLTPLIGGIPLAVMELARTTISTPFGILDFAMLGLYGLIVFHFVIIPLIVTASANIVNMFAGLNGLEAGSAAIMAAAIIFLSLLRGGKQLISAIILIPFLGAVLAFLVFNKYPSRVFPGDVGTLSMGAILVCSAMLGNLERAVLIMFIPYIANAVLFFIGKSRGREPPREAAMNADGTLPAPSIWSLRSVLLRIKPMNEKTAVYVIWSIIGLFAIIGVLVYSI